MKRRLVISAVATAILALAAASPVAAHQSSCVGRYASMFAQEDPRGFADEISEFARSERPFGFTTVAPFAHIPGESCPTDD